MLGFVYYMSMGGFVVSASHSVVSFCRFIHALLFGTDPDELRTGFTRTFLYGLLAMALLFTAFWSGMGYTMARS